jgi:flavin-binding protein dodecin
MSSKRPSFLIVASNSVNKIIELIGTSESSWKETAKSAIEKADESLRELRIAGIEKLDLQLENGRVVAYRARVKVSFKYGAE